LAQVGALIVLFEEVAERAFNQLMDRSKESNTASM